jgi:hypothetical protein
MLRTDQCQAVLRSPPQKNIGISSSGYCKDVEYPKKVITLQQF